MIKYVSFNLSSVPIFRCRLEIIKKYTLHYWDIKAAMFVATLGNLNVVSLDNNKH